MKLYEQTLPGVKLLMTAWKLYRKFLKAKLTVISLQMNNFSLIIRQEGDLGCKRTKNTACLGEIKCNLERRLFVWKAKLKKETLDQM